MPPIVTKRHPTWVPFLVTNFCLSHGRTLYIQLAARVEKRLMMAIQLSKEMGLST